MVNYKLSIKGSPPQVRGKHNATFSLYKSKRITPAGAGKTVLPYNQHRSAEDHPRRCGENMTIWVNIIANLGSPPQVRGKPKRLMVDSFGDRITPAGAGKTLKRSFRNQPFCS